METFARKPHAGNAGYVCERKARLGGHIVVYDRQAGFEIDADHRWIVMHEPSSNHVAVRTEREARQAMKDLAEARSLEEAPIADIFPSADAPDLSAAELPTPTKGSRPAPRQPAAGVTPEERADLDRFLADPENAPTPEGKAALRRAFGLA
jgi:hypothetical protein